MFKSFSEKMFKPPFTLQAGEIALIFQCFNLLPERGWGVKVFPSIHIPSAIYTIIY